MSRFYQLGLQGLGFRVSSFGASFGFKTWGVHIASQQAKNSNATNDDDGEADDDGGNGGDETSLANGTDLESLTCCLASPHFFCAA